MKTTFDLLVAVSAIAVFAVFIIGTNDKVKQGKEFIEWFKSKMK